MEWIGRLIAENDHFNVDGMRIGGLWRNARYVLTKTTTKKINRTKLKSHGKMCSYCYRGSNRCTSYTTIISTQFPIAWVNLCNDLRVGVQKSHSQSQTHSQLWMYVDRPVIDQITKVAHPSNSRGVELSNGSLTFVLESIFDYTT